MQCSQCVSPARGRGLLLQEWRRGRGGKWGSDGVGECARSD